MDEKMEYEAPTLTEVGSFEEVTQSINTVPTALDGSYQQGESGTIFS